MKGGPVSKLLSSKDIFVIADRQGLSEAFDCNASILDFTLEEPRRLRPLIQCLNLEERYLSKQVQECSTIKGGLRCLEVLLTNDFKRRALGLCEQRILEFAVLFMADAF